MTFGRDQNAFTGFDQTVYTLALPDTKPETLDRGLLFLSDVAFAAHPDPEEIESERQIILEEKRARAGRRPARARTRCSSGSRPSPRSAAACPSAPRRRSGPSAAPTSSDYYARWYVPSNMTVIVVGDIDPPTRWRPSSATSARAPRRPGPRRVPAGVTSTLGTRAIVVTDPELTQAEVSLTRVEPPRAAGHHGRGLPRATSWTSSPSGCFDRRLDRPARRRARSRFPGPRPPPPTGGARSRDRRPPGHGRRPTGGGPRSTTWPPRCSGHASTASRRRSSRTPAPRSWPRPSRRRSRSRPASRARAHASDQRRR